MKAWAICIPSAWASQKCASQFYEGFQKLHLPFMSVSKICIAIYEGHKKVHLLCIRVSNIRITVLWRSSKFASPFYERLKILHRNLWRSKKKNASPLYKRFNKAHHGFMKAFKMCISFVWVFQKFASRFLKAIANCTAFRWASQKCASQFYEGLQNVRHSFMKVFKIYMRYTIHTCRPAQAHLMTHDTEAMWMYMHARTNLCVILCPSGFW